MKSWCERKNHGRSLSRVVPAMSVAMPARRSLRRDIGRSSTTTCRAVTISAVRWGPLVRGDLHDTALLAGTLQLHSVVAVMHFAAFANVGDAVTDPEAYYRNNVEGTLALLSAMRRARVMRWCFPRPVRSMGSRSKCRSTSLPR